MRKVPTLLLITLLPTLASGSKVIPDAWRSGCPAFNTSSSWRDWLSGKVPHAPRMVGNGVAVEFRMAKKVKNLDLGGIPTNACYTVTYVTAPAGSYPKAGYSNDIWESGVTRTGPPPRKHGLPGDPNRYQVNVWGQILPFDEQGTIYDHNGNAVGVMTCVIDDAGCSAY